MKTALQKYLGPVEQANKRIPVGDRGLEPLNEDLESVPGLYRYLDTSEKKTVRQAFDPIANYPVVQPVLIRQGTSRAFIFGSKLRNPSRQLGDIAPQRRHMSEIGGLPHIGTHRLVMG